MRLMWIGGPTTRLEIGAFRVLTDPMLGEGPEAFVMRRHPTTGALNVPIPRLTPLPHADLDDIDLVLTSHLHSDHFDTRAVERLDHGIPVIAPTPNVAQLRDWGFHDVTGVDWGAERILSKLDERLRLVALPAHHSHDAEADHDLGAVNGYLIEHTAPGSVFRIYWTGDTVWFDELRDVAAALPDVDLLLPHLGGVGSSGGPWGMISLDAEEGTRVTEVVDPGLVIPIHHSTFPFYVEPVSVFVRRLVASAYTGRVLVLREGETWTSTTADAASNVRQP